MNFSSIKAFTRHLATLPAAVEHAQHVGLEAAGRDLVAHAKALIGTEKEGWAALAESTVRQKQAAGQTGRVSATDPLLAKGDLRDSIGATVEGHKVTLGSSDPVAPYQELGTPRIPPRPFISATMFKDGHTAARAVAEHVVAAVAGRPVSAADPTKPE